MLTGNPKMAVSYHVSLTGSRREQPGHDRDQSPGVNVATRPGADTFVVTGKKACFDFDLTVSYSTPLGRNDPVVLLRGDEICCAEDLSLLWVGTHVQRANAGK